jgi:hypothetical protein
MRRGRNRDRDGPPKRVQHRDPERANADAVLAKIKGKMLSARRIYLSKEPRAVADRIVRMLDNALVDQRRCVFSSETRQDGFSIGGAVQRKALADGRQGDEPLLARNLIDEYRGAAR